MTRNQMTLKERNEYDRKVSDNGLDGLFLGFVTAISIMLYFI